jgi:hypothetical protein
MLQGAQAPRPEFWWRQAPRGPLGSSIPAIISKRRFDAIRLAVMPSPCLGLLFAWRLSKQIDSTEWSK